MSYKIIDNKHVNPYIETGDGRQKCPYMAVSSYKMQDNAINKVVHQYGQKHTLRKT